MLPYSSLLTAPVYSHPFGWTVKQTVLARSGSSGGDLCSERGESGLGFSMVRLGLRGVTEAEGAEAISHAGRRRLGRRKESLKVLSRTSLLAEVALSLKVG